MASHRIYNGRDPREMPSYGIADAARFIDVPPATLRSWVAGRTTRSLQGGSSFEPVIAAADPAARRLSFYNLVEAHVLRALRTRHDVPLKHVRPAIAYAEKELGIQRLLLSREMQTAGGEIFLEHLGELVNLSKSGQLAVKELLAAHLNRVERDDRAIPIRLYPVLPGEKESRSVVIDPTVSFGRPTVAGSGILTSVLVQRINAGENVADLVSDYGLTEAQIVAAAVFERAA
jgi:uncharacterized protein (DUF433 family)